MTRLTLGGGSFSFAVWSPDGRYVVFCNNTGGVFWARADGAGKPQPLTQNKSLQFPWSFSPDGKRLAFAEPTPGDRWDLWTMPVETQGGQLQAGKPEIFLQTSSSAITPAFSPDGRWIAYQSWESGVGEIYVQAFPNKGAKHVVSNSGGFCPVWSGNGRELFYRTNDQRIMVVTYSVKGDSFAADKPRLWTDKRLANIMAIRNFDITPDGKRFVVLMPAEGDEERRAQNQVTFLLNFFDELRRRVPMGSK
jgi:serine/threonine-protein kinase